MCSSLSSSFSLCQGWGDSCNFFTASSASLFHPTLYCVFFFQSPSSPAFFTSLFTQSSHLSLGLPRLLLPCSRNYAALFGNRSSAILSTCPAHCNLLLTSLSVKLLCTPVSSLNSTILRLSALVTLAIFRTQLFSHTCSLCCCRSVSAKVSVPYRQAGVTQVLPVLKQNWRHPRWVRIPGWRAGCSIGLLFVGRKKADGIVWQLQVSDTYMGGKGALVG